MSTLASKPKKLSNAALTDPTPITVNKLCDITNNAAFDILVLDAYSEVTKPVQEVFEQTLKILPADGTNDTFIKATSTGKVMLDDKHKNDNGDSVDTTGYELIIAKADCLYPIKATHSTRAKDKTSGNYYYPGVTIVAEEGADTDKTKNSDYVNMQSAEKFLQNIMAYPSYDLAKDYQAACDNAMNATSDDDTDYIGDFFATTVSYKKVDLNMVTAVTTYYEQFPYIWTNYHGGKTYYLYSSDSGVIAYQGSLEVTVATDVPAKTDKTLPGFSFKFTDAKDNVTTMHFNKGKFVDNLDLDIPGICFSGSFSLKSDLTNVAADNGIIAVIMGRIGSVKVIGFDEQQKETEVKDPDSGDTSKKWSGTYDLLHVDSIGKAINLLMVAGGLFMTFKELYGGCKKLRDYVQKKLAEKKAKGDDSPLTEDDFVQVKSDTQEYMTDQRAGSQREAARIDPAVQPPKPEDLRSMMDDYSKQITERVNAELKLTLQEGLDAQLDLYNKILDITHPKSLDQIKDNMDAAQGQLDTATTPETCATVLPEVTVAVGKINVDIQGNFNSAMKKADGDQKQGMDEANKAAEERGKVSQDVDASRERAEEGKEPEDADYPFEEFNPGIFE